MQDAHDFSGYLPLLRLGSFELPTYFFVSSLAFCLCLLWLVRRAEARTLPRNQALDLSLCLMGFGFLGARLFHVLLEEPRHYLEAPGRIFEFWKGGFVWYGGALLGTLACWIYIRQQKLKLTLWLDVFAPVGALGYAIGRMACVLTGCCFGSVCELVSNVRFRYPTQAFSVVWELAVLALLLHLEKRRRSIRPPKWLRNSGQVFLVWVVLHALGRIVMEIFRADLRGPAPLGVSVSAWISFAILAAAAFLLRRRAKALSG